MSLIDKLNSHEAWTSFLISKMMSGNMNQSQIDDLTAFVRNKEYLPVIDKIKKDIGFLPPSKVLISKQYSSKKRTVYVYSREENYVLKLLTYLLIRQYDYVFAKNLYSFRAKNGVKKAIDYFYRVRYNNYNRQNIRVCSEK